MSLSGIFQLFGWEQLSPRPFPRALWEKSHVWRGFCTIQACFSPGILTPSIPPGVKAPRLTFPEAQRSSWPWMGRWEGDISKLGNTSMENSPLRLSQLLPSCWRRDKSAPGKSCPCWERWNEARTSPQLPSSLPLIKQQMSPSKVINY